MWRFKSCPRCNGDMLIDQDHYGWYEWYLQCGYLQNLIGIIKVRPQDKVETRVAENV